MIYPSSRLKEFSKITELSGKMERSKEEKLMHTVLESEEAINEGKLIMESLNQGISSFIPDQIFENLVKDFKVAKSIYGEKLLRQLTNEDEDALSRNLRLPEYQRIIKKRIQEKIEKLKDSELVNKSFGLTEKGYELAAFSLYMEELDHLNAKGLIGEKLNESISHYGDKIDFKKFKKGDRYKDIYLKRTLRKAIRRSHKDIAVDDLEVYQRQSKGKIYIVYGLDASGSMKGEKIKICKKAGIALAYKAINELDKVGLLVFGSDIESVIEPTTDFNLLLREIIKITAKKETNIALTIRKAIEIMPSENVTKHLILVTDSLPTYGKNPEKETLDAVSEAIYSGLTISVVGINLDEKGKKLAQEISEIGKGKLYEVKKLEELDSIIIQDYLSLK